MRWVQTVGPVQRRRYGPRTYDILSIDVGLVRSCRFDSWDLSWDLQPTFGFGFCATVRSFTWKVRAPNRFAVVSQSSGTEAPMISRISSGDGP